MIDIQKFRKLNWMWKILAILVVGIVGYSEFVKASDNDESTPNENKEAANLTEVSTDSKKFTVYKNATFSKRKYGNDGDSFYVQHGDGTTNFRLYFVDAPESWYKKSAKGSERKKKRIAEQGEYFNKLNHEATVNLGKDAKIFVKNLLSSKPFTVITRHEKVYSSDREYAFIVVKWKGKQRYLHELLVSKGLARIHTKGIDLPDNTTWQDQKDHLKKLEATAKKNQLGGWSQKK